VSAPLLLSFQAALLATLLAGVAGIALAGAMSQRRFIGRDLLDTLLLAPMVLPPTVLGYALLLSLGRESAIGRAFEAVFDAPIVFTFGAVVLAASISAFPFIVRSARTAMEDVDPRLVGAAATRGASPVRVFFTVVLPQSKGGVASGLALGFARALGDFGVTLMIAGNMPGATQTGALAIYDAVQAGRDNDAAAMALVMAAVAIVLLYAGQKLLTRRRHAW
jgi:molybdate transport system permease protein